ncbi:hypothetical protein PANT_20d00078 [Moesziomyces antarcticus T-34]|uniref:Uncharacterized protein n=1 Tax=Pseudozyma antarctica (strain T-34) TaxID=1151754 RepID=M9MFP0_PSEA3|nr:hypothetical protein PANT_20d00078 [Moesziomyces antarcticus T-34]
MQRRSPPHRSVGMRAYSGKGLMLSPPLFESRWSSVNAEVRLYGAFAREPGSRDLQRRLGNGGVRRGHRLSAAPDTLVIYAERSLGPRPNSRLAEPASSFAHTSLSSGELAHHIGDNLAAMMPAPLP